MAAKAILLEAPVKRYAYLVAQGKQSILIDPGSAYHADILIEKINEEIQVSDLAYIILQSNDYLNITAVKPLIEAGFNGDIICSESHMKYIEQSLNHPVMSIESLNDELNVGEHTKLTFITAPFLPFPEGFLTYDHIHQTLYSSHLFSQTNNENEQLFERIHAFHQYVLPSIDFVRPVIKKIKQFDIKRIYPRLGDIITQSSIKSLLFQVMTNDFYHTARLIEKHGNHVNIHYEMICNHMLKKLVTLFHRQDIYQVFLGSKIELDLTVAIEIKNSELHGYKLWNYFFERIFEKQGMTWLSILEPTVKKYEKLYEVQLPAIYTTDQYRQHTTITSLHAETNTLIEKVKHLETEISNTADKMLRDDQTNLYNESFMHQYMIQHIKNEHDNDDVAVLALYQIDDLAKINKKYGTKQGDQTIRNLVYLLNNKKNEETLLFKQSGPGIFVYIPRIKKEEVTKLMLNCRNSIQASDVFVEQVTVSIAFAYVTEIDEDKDEQRRLEQWKSLVLKRMEMAKSRGKSQIIDDQINLKDMVDGVVLIVDEDETYQNMMIRMFNRINYKAIIAKDIDQAEDYMTRYPVDVVISELNLSKLDGFQFKHRLNQSKDFKDLPFIMVSHHKNLDVVIRANMLHIDLILQKPIIPEELIGHINRLRQRNRSL